MHINGRVILPITSHRTSHFMAKIPTTKLILVTKYAGDAEGYIKLVVYVPGSNKPKFASTKYKVAVSAWDPKDEIVRKTQDGYSTINHEIHKMKTAVVMEFNAALFKGRTEFTADYIATVLRPKQVGGDFLQFYRDHIAYLETRCTPAYCAHFTVEWKYLCEKWPGLSFKDVTAGFLERYEISLSKFAGTTRNSKMKRLKEVVEKAIEQELISGKAVAGYKWPAYEQPLREYLTPEEVGAIERELYGGTFDGDAALRQTAAFFLVECHSGIRFSDWSRFEIERLVEQRHFKVGRTQKNKQAVYLPLDKFKSLDRIVTYITANKIRFTLDLQVVNRYLKVVGSACGIKKHLTTHIGRHTFGTTLGMYGYNTAEIAQAMAISEGTAKTYVAPTRRGFAAAAERNGGW